MANRNLFNEKIFNFSNIYWLLKDKDFYGKVKQLLSDKFIFNETVWSFSIYHGDFAGFAEYIKWKLDTKSMSIGFNYFESEILKVDNFKVREYNPLINSRVHDLGALKINILDKDFKITYHEFLVYLYEKKTSKKDAQLESKDFLLLATYLLLQDRVEDALKIFLKIESEKLGDELLIQYDYLAAYLNLYSDENDFQYAKSICIQHLENPSITWRNRFVDLANQ